jgi:hypothetical protein
MTVMPVKAIGSIPAPAGQFRKGNHRHSAIAGVIHVIVIPEQRFVLSVELKSTQIKTPHLFLEVDTLEGRVVILRRLSTSSL